MARKKRNGGSKVKKNNRKMMNGGERKSRERKVIKAVFLAGSVSEDDRVLVDISTYNESVDRARRS